jgi:N-acyl-D-amino-acid deacylase
MDSRRTLIQGGRLVDPSIGLEATRDIVVDGDRVSDVALSSVVGADCVVDARGMTVLPGFIDVHTHSDFRIPLDPTAPARLHQGVTTDITGNCGFSPFPLGPGHTELGALIGDQLSTRWRGLDEFGQDLASSGISMNVAPLVGLGSVRTRAMRHPGQAATSEELTAMRSLVESALEQGAFGVSSGLVYFPNYCLSLEETVELLAPLAEAGRIYATHIRDERDHVVEAVSEALTVARKAKVRLQVSHHKALGKANWGRTATTLAMMKMAAEHTGLAVGVDFYPYTSGSTGLSSLLPAEVLEAGFQHFRSQMTDKSFKSKIRERIEHTAQFRLDEIVISTCHSRPEVSGVPLLEAAESQSMEPLDLLLDLLAAEGERITMLVSAASEQDLAQVRAYPNSMHGSDAWLMTLEQARYEHPRNIHSATKLLAPALAGQISLHETVEQLATRPAKQFAIPERGSLAPGNFADIVIVDPARADRYLRTISDGRSYPEIVRWVFVNGVAVIEDGVHSGRKPGRVLRAS